MKCNSKNILFLSTLLSSFAMNTHAVTVHDNKFNFYSDSINPVQSINFTYSDQYDITGGQPLDGVYVSGGYVDVKAGRKGSQPVANSFNGNLQNMDAHMLGLESASSKPYTLNFWIKGILTINGDSFPVYLAQGHNTKNNWWIGSLSGSDGKPSKHMNLTSDNGHVYCIEQDPNHPDATDYAFIEDAKCSE
ncbi:hypothetical protein [Dyella choica]|uniref:Uncharacterized protein n=1 Tax=Dyella choica TaxID=1927959 RepID=A0A3S0S9W3_9GAMM|nr:hypothetical protein [Dyella choica]RUL75300.1 hypothetical protein EKH80_11270 [Dyella choica]